MVKKGQGFDFREKLWRTRWKDARDKHCTRRSQDITRLLWTSLYRGTTGTNNFFCATRLPIWGFSPDRGTFFSLVSCLHSCFLHKEIHWAGVCTCIPSTASEQLSHALLLLLLLFIHAKNSIYITSKMGIGETKVIRNHCGHRPVSPHQDVGN